MPIVLTSANRSCVTRSYVAKPVSACDRAAAAAWNGLPSAAVSRTSLDALKSALTAHSEHSFTLAY